MAPDDPEQSEATTRQLALKAQGLGAISQISERLYAGGAPVHRGEGLKVTWAGLLERKVDTVYSLTLREETDVPPTVTREVHAINDTADLKAAGASLKYLEKVVARMDRALADGRCLYVHCLSGVSRTALVLVAWEMKRSKLSRDEALARLRVRRPCLAPNAGFMELLAKWQAR